MKINILSLSKGISSAIEKHVRLEILREREAILRKELAIVQSQINGLTGREIERKVAPQRRKIVSRKQSKSVRALLIETLKRTKGPMKAKDLTRLVIRKGYRSARKDPGKTVDTILRKYKEMFKKVAPSTFQLIK